MHWIAILDCNSFFVSCERLFRPDLAKRPVVVLSNNDGCVVARSQEIKDRGVPMGVPYFQVRDTLKDIDAAVFSSHFSLYRDLSRRVFTALRQVASGVEVYSIDEAFFAISVGREAASDAWRIKKDIETRVGIPVSIGVAATKTLAKYANALAKRGSGVRVLPQREWETVAKAVPLGELWGVASGRSAQFRAHALETCRDLMDADRTRVARLFGVEGARLQAELRGTPAVPRGRRTLQKSLMSTKSFQHTTNDRAVVEDAVAYHARRAAEELRALGAVARTVRVVIRPSRHSAFALHRRSDTRTLTVPSNSTDTFLDTTLDLTRALYQPGVPYKKAGVIITDIAPLTTQSASLFASPVANESVQPLDRTIDALNRRFGLDTVSRARQFKDATWQRARAHLSPLSTTDWQNLPVVTAK